MRSNRSNLPEPEKTKSGAEIVRAVEPGPAISSQGDWKVINAIDKHVKKYIGPIETVWHEKDSEYVHVDVHVVPASDGRPFQTLVTSGMSELKMMVPEIATPFQHGELVALMPIEWRMPSAKNKLPVGWPLLQLHYMGRYPHQYNTWLAAGHSMPGGDSLQKEGFAGVVLGRSVILPQAFHIMRSRKRETHFWSLWAVYEEEMQYKLDKGSDALFDLFAEKGITDLYERGRLNAITGGSQKAPRKRHY